MDTYLVGGAIRDKLLGIPVVDRDWVIVGGSPSELQARGFRRVGKDFPVYLHPQSNEEYALARTERKVAAGHRGFETESGPAVTLEQDLYRRDLTINAIAEDAEGRLIDPYHGIRDIESRILRHVSAAFSEDPLRVLRAATFAARLPEFQIHGDTLDLMTAMVRDGELEHLAPERIFMETEKALASDSPHIYFEVLHKVGAHSLLWPEIKTGNVKRLARWEADNVPLHAYVVLLTELSERAIEDISVRLKAPADFREMALLATRFYSNWSSEQQLSSADIVRLLYELDAFRRPERFDALCALLQQVAHVLGNAEAAPDPWRDYLDVANRVSAREFKNEFSGPELGEAIKKRQIELIGMLRREQQSET